MISIMNAAGTVKNPADVEHLLKVGSSVLSEITLGSYTLKPRPGNTGNTFWHDDDTYPTSLKALGLPNPGIEAALEFLPDLAGRIKRSGKRARVSIAGESVEEYVWMTRLLSDQRAVGEIELNLGCPNMREDGNQKPIFAFDPVMVGEIVAGACEACSQFGDPTVAIKVSPYSDPALLTKIAKIFDDAMVEAKQTYLKVVTCNTFPNGYVLADDGQQVIGAKGGHAGIGGHAMKYIALGQVRQFREFLPKRIRIIGVGGVCCGADMLEMERAGASAVQIGTAFLIRGARIFSEIAAQYVEALGEAEKISA